MTAKIEYNIEDLLLELKRDYPDPILDLSPHDDASVIGNLFLFSCNHFAKKWLPIRLKDEDSYRDLTLCTKWDLMRLFLESDRSIESNQYSYEDTKETFEHLTRLLANLQTDDRNHQSITRCLSQFYAEWYNPKSQLFDKTKKNKDFSKKKLFKGFHDRVDNEKMALAGDPGILMLFAFLYMVLHLDFFGDAVPHYWREHIAEMSSSLASIRKKTFKSKGIQTLGTRGAVDFCVAAYLELLLYYNNDGNLTKQFNLGSNPYGAIFQFMDYFSYNRIRNHQMLKDLLEDVFLGRFQLLDFSVHHLSITREYIFLMNLSYHLKYNKYLPWWRGMNRRQQKKNIIKSKEHPSSD